MSTPLMTTGRQFEWIDIKINLDGGQIMDILFTVLPFLFMLLFLNTFRALINRENTSLLIFATSVTFGALLFVCYLAFAR
ncbi:hypothetical protein AB6A23_24675 [Paenibacillus tarimensis]